MRLISWLPALAAVGAMLILAATLFPYFAASHNHTVAGYVPLTIGLLAIMVLSASLTFAASPVGTSRHGRAVGAGALVGISFVFLFFLFTLNTLGS
jgi:hypothetical protein